MPGAKMLGSRVVLSVDRSVLLLGNDDGHDSDDGDGGQDAADDDPDSGPAAASVSAACFQAKLQLCFPLVLRNGIYVCIIYGIYGYICMFVQSIIMRD